MGDRDLLVFGCLVTFIAASGAYVYMRETFLDHAGVVRERWQARKKRSSERKVA